jgi:hypothetical protein
MLALSSPSPGERDVFQEVSRTASSFAAPPDESPTTMDNLVCETSCMFQRDSGLLVPNGTYSVYIVKIIVKLIYSCVIIILYHVNMLSNNYFSTLCTNFNFSVLYNTEAKGYKVVSIFSIVSALALSLIFIHQGNKICKQTQLSSVYQCCCIWSDTARRTVYVWRSGVNHSSGSEICTISPNGD